MKIISFLTCLGIGLMLCACTTGKIAGGPGGASTTRSTSVGGGNNPPRDASSTIDPNNAMMTPVTSKACIDKTLIERLSVTPIDLGAAVNTTGTRILPLADGNVLIGWHPAGGGDAHLSRVKLDGTPLGNDIVVPGTILYGLATDNTNIGVLIRRGANEMHWVLLNAAGAVIATQKLVGVADPLNSAVNDEWLDADAALIRWGTKARLLWNGAAYVAYFSKLHHFSDGLNHQGDQLRYFDSNGASAPGGWTWGCSHSIDLNLAAAGTTMHPVCMSDCYPTKGVIYNNSVNLFTDPSGNCGGNVSSWLGGVVHRDANLFITFASPVGRASMDIGLVARNDNGAAAAVRWLSSSTEIENGVGLANYGPGMLAGWRVGNTQAALLQLGSDGSPTGDIIAVSDASHIALFTSTRTDFTTLNDGDVLWANVVSGQLQLARVDACVP